MRRLVVCLLALAPALPLSAEEGGEKARLEELVDAYRKVEKSPAWADVKLRRDLLAEMSRLDLPEALPVLYEAFLEDREPICRIPAMEGVVRCGSTRARKMLVRAAMGDRNDVWVKLLPDALAGCADPELADWLVENVLRRRGDDDLRAAVAAALGRMPAPAAAAPLRELLAEKREDVRVRYESLLALARIERERAADAIEPWLGSEDARLREGAVRALAATGAAGAVDRVLPLARDADPLVQEAVVDVVRRAGATDGVPALVSLLESSASRRAADAARVALEMMTGQCFGFDAAAWRRWWSERDPRAPLEPVDRAAPSSATTYHGLGLASDRLVFVVDASGSMDAGRPARIETARVELAKTLGMLTPETRFNVVAFSGSPAWWREAEVPATPENVESAKRFVSKLTAGGGTNVWDTLVETFEKNRDIDTIYFLADGSPSRGRVTEKEEILARIRWMNRMRKVRIHTIALLRGHAAGHGANASREDDEDEAARFMAHLAAATDGTFLEIR